MHAFDVLGDPVRRRILELLADGERAAGEVTAVIREEFGVSQPAVSMHLRVLREGGFATVRADGARRLYRLAPAPLQEVDTWLERYRRFWTPHLDALATELAREKREKREKRERRLTRDRQAQDGAPSGAQDGSPHDQDDQPHQTRRTNSP